MLLGEHVAALDALGEADLLGSGEQRHLSDRAQVQTQRIEARFDAQIELAAFAAALFVQVGAQLGNGFELGLALVVAVSLFDAGAEQSSPANMVCSSSVSVSASATAVPVAGAATANRISTSLLTLGPPGSIRLPVGA